MRFGRQAAAILVAAIFILSAAIQASADIRLPRVIGWAGFGTNDWIGDGQDRWRTGSYGLNLAIGRKWAGKLPRNFGDITEFRLHGEVLAPAHMGNPRPGDRKYAGVLTFGAHSQFARGDWEVSLGSDLVITGPQTRLDRLHAIIHRQSGGAAPPRPGEQIGNGVYLNGAVEVGRTLAVSPTMRIRPFVAAQLGHETLARIGIDLAIGRLGTSALMSRDASTGIRYPVVPDRDPTGLSLALGADIAHVTRSVLLPRNLGYDLTSNRHRFRAGITYDTRIGSVFAGIAWLGPEFVGQGTGQRVGAITANFRF